MTWVPLAIRRGLSPYPITLVDETGAKIVFSDWDIQMRRAGLRLEIDDSYDDYGAFLDPERSWLPRRDRTILLLNYRYKYEIARRENVPAGREVAAAASLLYEAVALGYLHIPA